MQPTLGSRQNVILAALTLSFLEALEADGIERDHAIELAEMWGGTLERSGTLVAGASCCDFRFRVPANAEAPSGATPRPALPMVAAWFPAQTSGEPSY